MQNLDVTQETKAQLRSEKSNSGKNHSKHIKRNKLFLTQNLNEIDKTEIKGVK